MFLGDTLRRVAGRIMLGSGSRRLQLLRELGRILEIVFQLLATIISSLTLRSWLRAGTRVYWVPAKNWLCLR